MRASPLAAVSLVYVVYLRTYTRYVGSGPDSTVPCVGVQDSIGAWKKTIRLSKISTRLTEHGRYRLALINLGGPRHVPTSYLHRCLRTGGSSV
ncbi:hypothetical protein F5Y14DRAFT_397406, partial [Nemania sp. NC0429]